MCDEVANGSRTVHSFRTLRMFPCQVISEHASDDFLGIPSPTIDLHHTANQLRRPRKHKHCQVEAGPHPMHGTKRAAGSRDEAVALQSKSPCHLWSRPRTYGVTGLAAQFIQRQPQYYHHRSRCVTAKRTSAAGLIFRSSRVLDTRSRVRTP
jgi:hypothetical protein